MITVPLPATPKGGDGAEKDALPESNSSRTESALAQLILPPARAAGDDDDDDDRSFLSMDSPSPRPPSLRDLEPPPPRSGDAATAATAERYRRARVSVPTSSLGPAPSPRAASARRRAGSWLGAASGGVGSAGPGSPRGHERAWSVSGLGSALRPRASLKGGGSRDEARLSGDFFLARASRRSPRDIVARRAPRGGDGGAPRRLRPRSGGCFGENRRANGGPRRDAPRRRGSLRVGFRSRGANRTGDERECFAFDARDFQPGGVGVLLGAAARAVASLARRGERATARRRRRSSGAARRRTFCRLITRPLASRTGTDPGRSRRRRRRWSSLSRHRRSAARARRAEKTLDALLRVAVAASSLGATTVPNKGKGSERPRRERRFGSAGSLLGRRGGHGVSPRRTRASPPPWPRTAKSSRSSWRSPRRRTRRMWPPPPRTRSRRRSSRSPPHPGPPPPRPCGP